jgi:hypothetical protein
MIMMMMIMMMMMQCDDEFQLDRFFRSVATSIIYDAMMKNHYHGITLMFAALLQKDLGF